MRAPLTRVFGKGFSIPNYSQNVTGKISYILIFTHVAEKEVSTKIQFRTCQHPKFLEMNSFFIIHIAPIPKIITSQFY